MSYAAGKRALGICDRTGQTYKLSELVWEVQNGVKTGFRVGRDVVDPDQPQNFLGRVKINDPQSLQNPRPDFAPGDGPMGMESYLEQCAIYGRLRWKHYRHNNEWSIKWALEQDRMRIEAVKTL
jgi:hypothetical protein